MGKGRRRRASGEGHVRKRADGRYEVQVTLGQDLQGKQIRKSVYGATQAEALAKARELEQARDAGTLTPKADKITLADYLAIWLRDVIQPNRADATHRTYQNQIRLHINPELGHYTLSKLQPHHVQQWINEKRQQLSLRTVIYLRSVLRNALQEAVTWGWLARNPAANIKLPSPRPQKLKTLTQEQAAAFLVTVEGHRLEYLYRLALSLGMRRGEILALRWDAVDFTAGTLTIKGAKTESGDRTLHLPEQLVALLRAQWARLQRERQHPDWREHGQVFPSEVGTPLRGTSLLRHFKAALKEAGLPTTIRFHDLRHSCATFLALQGVPIKVIAEILGHRDPAFTLRTYLHSQEDAQREALRGVAQYKQKTGTGGDDS